jgi:hypothetical protein
VVQASAADHEHEPVTIREQQARTVDGDHTVLAAGRIEDEIAWTDRARLTLRH